MRIQVPEEHARAFRDLIALPVEKRRALVRSLRDSAPSLMLVDLADNVAESTGMARAEAMKYVAILGSLFRTRLIADEPVETFVADIREAGEDLREEAGDSREVDWDAFCEDTSTALLMEEPLGVTAKAFDVATDHQRVFASARILSDVRPVFHEDPSEKPRAAVVLHSLKISYYEGGTQQDFFVALDVEDLRALNETVARALSKEAALGSLLKEQGITWLKPAGERHGDD
ncbi:MAG: hypothetical protein R6V05_15070 [Candidatus Brocadiia bacterium]